MPGDLYHGGPPQYTGRPPIAAEVAQSGGPFSQAQVWQYAILKQPNVLDPRIEPAQLRMAGYAATTATAQQGGPFSQASVWQYPIQHQPKALDPLPDLPQLTRRTPQTAAGGDFFPTLPSITLGQRVARDPLPEAPQLMLRTPQTPSGGDFIQIRSLLHREVTALDPRIEPAQFPLRTPQTPSGGDFFPRPSLLWAQWAALAPLPDLPPRGAPQTPQAPSGGLFSQSSVWQYRLIAQWPAFEPRTEPAQIPHAVLTFVASTAPGTPGILPALYGQATALWTTDYPAQLKLAGYQATNPAPSGGLFSLAAVWQYPIRPQWVAIDPLPERPQLPLRTPQTPAGGDFFPTPPAFLRALAALDARIEPAQLRPAGPLVPSGGDFFPRPSLLLSQLTALNALPDLPQWPRPPFVLVVPPSRPGILPALVRQWAALWTTDAPAQLPRPRIILIAPVTAPQIEPGYLFVADTATGLLVPATLTGWSIAPTATDARVSSTETTLSNPDTWTDLEVRP